jgi:hypothetical protein
MSRVRRPSVCGPGASRRASRSSDCGPGPVRRGGCPPALTGQGLATLATIVEHYIANQREGADGELAYFRGPPTLRDAVRKAAHAEDGNNKRYAYQHRISPEVLKESAALLEAALPRLAAARTLEDLHDVVREEIG